MTMHVQNQQLMRFESCKLLFAEDSNRLGRTNEYFAVANSRDGKFNGSANNTGTEELSFEISRVVGM